MKAFLPLTMLLLCGLYAPAQQTVSSPSIDSPVPHLTLIPRSKEQRERAFAAEHRILLNATVRDGNGMPVTELAASDFSVFDDREQRSVSVKAVDGASAAGQAHILIVLDAENNSSRRLSYQRKELDRYLARAGSTLKFPTSIVVLSASGAQSGRPSRDPSVLRAELSARSANLRGTSCDIEGGIAQAQTGSQTFAPYLDNVNRDSEKIRRDRATCWNSRFVTSLSALSRIARQQSDIPGRAIMIWLGDGWPLLTDAEFQPDDPTLSRNYYDHLGDLSAFLREAQITLDAVTTPDFYRVSEPGAERLVTWSSPTGETAHTPDFALPRLVNQTGGRFLNANRDLVSGIEACISDADYYYTISFDASPATGSGEYRTLAVKVAKPGLAVRTNAAYFMRP